MASTRDAFLRVRVRPSEHQRIADGARAADQTISELVRQASLRRADELLAQGNPETEAS